MHGHSSEMLYQRLAELTTASVIAGARMNVIPCVLEIGTAQGGSAAWLMHGIWSAKLPAKLVTCDPYGKRPYPMSNSRYDLGFEHEAMLGLAGKAKELNLDWHHERHTSWDFLSVIAPLGFWQDGERHNYHWAMAFLDGEHIWPTVRSELCAIESKLLPGGTIVIDNTNHAQPVPGDSLRKEIEQYASEHGFDVEFTMPPDGSEFAVLKRKIVQPKPGIPKDA